MPMRKLTLWLSCLMLGTILLAGCAPRTGSGTTAAAATEDQDLLVDLPAIVIDIDNAGKATLAGVPVAELSPGLAALDTLISPETLGMLTESNIQHVQITTAPTGLEILVNGQALPTVSWDGESLAGTQQLLGLLGNEGLAMVESILPQIANVGIGVVLRFPLAQGAEALPLVADAESSIASAVTQAQEEFLAQAGSPARINVPITYASDGTFSIGTLTADELTILVGAPIESLTLTAEQVAQYSEMGLQTLSLVTDSEGVHMTLNGSPLPDISWGEGKLAYALSLAMQAGLVGSGEGGDMGVLIERLLPIIQTAEVNVQVTFP